jgi:DNA-binding beta-propeller fold protein YncE
LNRAIRWTTYGIVVAVSLSRTSAIASARAPGSHYRVVHGWPEMPPGETIGPPAGVAVDSHGDVVVFHRANAQWKDPMPLDGIKKDVIWVFSGRTGKVIRRWGSGLFAMPHGLTIDAQDNLWFTDVALHQVFKFSPDGKLLLTLGEKGVPGNDASHFNRPSGVAVRKDGSILVSDGYRNTRVMVFSGDGKFVRQWGAPGSKPGEFNLPHAVAVGADGRVLVADRENDRVQVFDDTGRVLEIWKSPEIGRPYGISPMTGGRFVIVDGGEQPEDGPDRSGAAIVDAHGRVLDRFGRFGSYDGQFWGAHAVAVDRKQAIYVVDVSGFRVQKFVPQ